MAYRSVFEKLLPAAAGLLVLLSGILFFPAAANAQVTDLRRAVLAVVSENYISSSSMLRGYRSFDVVSLPWMTTGFSYTRLSRANLPDLRHCEFSTFVAFGGQVTGNARLAGGLGFKQINTTFPAYSNREEDTAWSATTPQEFSGPEAVIVVEGTDDVETAFDRNSEIWALAKVGTGVLGGHLYVIDVRILAGIRFWRALSFTQSFDFEISASSAQYRASYMRLAWGFGVGLCL